MGMVQQRQTGCYKPKGPAGTLTIRRLLERCREVSGSNASFEWVSEQFLLEHEVEPYRQLPHWVPGEMVGFSRVGCQKAITAGLSFRPLTETIQDTLAWDATRPADYVLRAGLAPEREQELLDEWRMVKREH